MTYSAYKLNKQGDNIQPWCTPFPVWNQSVSVNVTILSLVLFLYILLPASAQSGSKGTLPQFFSDSEPNIMVLRNLSESCSQLPSCVTIRWLDPFSGEISLHSLNTHFRFLCSSQWFQWFSNFSFHRNHRATILSHNIPLTSPLQTTVHSSPPGFSSLHTELV